MIAELIGAAIAVAYGIYTACRQRMPLFYWIVVLAMLTCLMGCIYTALYEQLLGWDGGSFHVGWLGNVGMFFFLHSAYYGAYDSLTDSKAPANKKYRLVAATAAVSFFAGGIAAIFTMHKGLWLLLLLVPITFTLYFAVKHLIIPDVEMGLIRVMRWYNVSVIALCVLMMLARLAAGSAIGQASSIGAGAALALCVPAARNGVQKWFM